MIETIFNQEDEESLQDAKAFVAQCINFFSYIQQRLDETEQLKQRMAALESENAAMRASAKSARSRSWTTTHDGWTLSV